jgi:TolB protein
VRGRVKLLAAVEVVLAASLLPTVRADAAFPGLNGRIAFGASGSSVPSAPGTVCGLSLLDRVATVNPDGSGGTDVPLSGVAGEPAWSADGTRLAFARMTPPDGSPPGIWTAGADGSGLQRVTLANPVGAGGRHFHFNPAWSPDGSRIVFEDFLDPPDGLAVIPASTSLRVVDVIGGADAPFVAPSVGGRHVRHPSWSADGTRISFTTNDGSSTGGDEIWTIEPTGANRHQVTATESPKGKSDWSPDSTTLVFQNGNVEFAEIAAIASTASEGTPSMLTSNEHFDGCATFSPDGGRIAYVEYPPQQPFADEVFTMAADGSGRTGPITSTPQGTINGLSWQPLSPPPPPPFKPPPILPPPPVQPTLLLDRPVSSTGEVPVAIGFDFPPNTDVLLAWEPGNGEIVVRSAPDGTIRSSMLVFPRDTLGGRSLDASFGGGVVARAPVLVVRGTYQPGGVSPSIFSHR